MKPESFTEQLSRLQQMAGTAGEGEIWDLSVNDQAAITAVLQSHDALLAALKEYRDWGCMTASDRDYFDRKFRALIQQADGAQEPT